MRAAGAFVDMEYPGHGTLTTVNSPIFTTAGEKRTPTPAPQLGDHTGEVLQELGYNAEEIKTLVRDGVAALGE